MLNLKKYIIRAEEERVGASSQHDIFVERKDKKKIKSDEWIKLYSHMVPKIDKKYIVDEMIVTGLRIDGTTNIKGYGSSIEQTLVDTEDYMRNKVLVQSKFNEIDSMTISFMVSND